jgi:hypothetical protein
MTDGPSSPPAFGSGIDIELFRGALAVVILPTLNEVDGLARTLSDMEMSRFDEPGQVIRILVIDGGSTDGTLEVARKRGIPVLNQVSRGKGGAMVEAVAWVHRLGIPFVVALDADATYPPDRILPTLDLLRGGTDLVIGVRRPVWGAPNDFKDLIHRVGNVGLSYAASVLMRRSILDLCSGFWGVSTERFMELNLSESSFAIEAELVLGSIRRGHIVHQIPVEYRERIGQAKLRALRDGSKILRSILRHVRTGPSAIEKRSRPAPRRREVPSLVRSPGSHGAQSGGGPARSLPGLQIAEYLQQELRPTPTQIEEYSRANTPVKNAIVGISSMGSGAPRDSVPALDLLAPTGPREGTGEPTGSLWSRSGGWMMSGRPDRTRFPSLLVLTSRLNFQSERQLQTLMSANGLLAVEPLPGLFGPVLP